MQTNPTDPNFLANMVLRVLSWGNIWISVDHSGGYMEGENYEDEG